jgi:glycosyltransferase involved in cell wall biosynthesis
VRWASGQRFPGCAGATVAGRIREAYGRDASVVHPPVEVDRFLAAARAPVQEGDRAPYLVFGRVVPYKKVDVAVEACVRLGRRLWVAGDGRDMDRVRAAAEGHPNIELLGRVPDERVAELFASAGALLFPGLEDFGIVPVEAQAAGLPVIAYGVGGARDSVIDGVTGVLYEDPSPAGLAAAIERFESLTIDDAALRANAREFAPERFARRFGELLLSPVGQDGHLSGAGGGAD